MAAACTATEPSKAHFWAAACSPAVLRAGHWQPASDCACSGPNAAARLGGCWWETYASDSLEFWLMTAS